MARDERLWERIQQICEVFGPAPDKFVCADCLEDNFLKQEIKKHRAAQKCDYCSKSSDEALAAPLSVALKPIAASFCRHYTPSWYAGLPEEYNQKSLLGTEDALATLPLTCHPDFLSEVVNFFGSDEAWVEETGSFFDFGKSMLYSWAKFSHLVKYGQRFFFFTSPPSPRVQFPFDLLPQEMFTKLGQLVVDRGLICSLDEETKLYRARLREAGANWPIDATQLGPPPNKNAGAQRMSPAGISYFYLAREKETALAEVINKPPVRMVIGQFSLRQELRVLDLVDLPMISIFDYEHRSEYEALRFLADFAKQISQPVNKDGLEHIEYVPTQVLSEYFATIYQCSDGRPLDGMVYPSAVQTSGVNVVLFSQKARTYVELVERPEPENVTVHDWEEFCRRVNVTAEQRR